MQSECGKSTRMKRVKSERQKEILEVFFRSNQNPNKRQIASLATQTSLSYTEVRNWFRNARIRKYPPTVAISDLPSATSLDLLILSDDVSDHMTPVGDHMRPISGHMRPVSDHMTSITDHVTSASDHITPVGTPISDHMTPITDHMTGVVTFTDKLDSSKTSPSSVTASTSGLTVQLDKKCTTMKHFIETLNSFPAQSATRTTILHNFITNHMNVADKIIVHQRLLGNAVEESSNKELRCRDVWSQLEHMFGIKQQESSSCDTKEADMIGCLKELFKDHKDYIATVKWLFQQNTDTAMKELQHCQSYHSYSGNPIDDCHGEKLVPPMTSNPDISTADLLTLSTPIDKNFYSMPTNHDHSEKELDSLLTTPLSEQCIKT